MYIDKDTIFFVLIVALALTQAYTLHRVNELYKMKINVADFIKMLDVLSEDEEREDTNERHEK